MKKRLCLFPLVMFQLSVEAQTSYLWSNGATTQTIEVNPSQTTTYYVTVTDNGTTYHDSVVVYVYQHPTISGASSVCENATTQLSVNASPAWQWLSVEPGTMRQSASLTVSYTGLVEAVGNGRSTIYVRTAEGCVATHLMDVSMKAVPLFDQVGPYLIGSTIPELPTTPKYSGWYYGINISGTWSPAINNTATTTYTFTPNAGQCALSTAMTIIVEPVSYALSVSDSSVCAGEEVILSVNTGPLSRSLKVGDYYGGGVIGYIFQPGDNEYVDGETHGIILGQPKNLDFYSFGCEVLDFTPMFATRYQGTSICIPYCMTGYEATNAIVYYCKGGYTPAHACYDLVHNGYSDWFLPSIYELLYINKNVSIINLQGTYWAISGSSLGPYGLGGDICPVGFSFPDGNYYCDNWWGPRKRWFSDRSFSFLPMRAF